VSCSHFSPIATENLLDVDKYENDCKVFAKWTKNHIRKIHLMGGEPLLHINVDKIMEITRKNFPKSTIKLVTNGILLDRMDSKFWNSCKINNIIISITYYPININVKRISELAAQYGIHVESFKRDLNLNFRKDVLDARGSQNINEMYKKCNPVCHQLHEGKLYICRVPAYVKYINQYFSKEFVVSENDYIDIYKIKDKKTILNYLKNPIPFCRYCKLDVSERIEWCLSKKEESEWF